MLLELQQIIVNPGQQMLLKDISWQQLEKILEEMGEKRAARISYSDGWLEIMVPLPEHEKDKEIFEAEIRNKYNVKFAIDDRNSIVNLWQSLGIFVLNVNQTCKEF